MRQNSKFVIGAISATNASQLTATIDTRGFSYARLYCLGNTNAGVSTVLTNNVVRENDDNSTNWVSIAATQAGTGFTPATNVQSTALAKIVHDIDLRGRKRYLNVLFTPHATTEIIIAAELSLPADGCTSAAEIGAAFVTQS
jgi:hypothetical protein